MDCSFVVTVGTNTLVGANMLVAAPDKSVVAAVGTSVVAVAVLHHCCHAKNFGLEIAARLDLWASFVGILASEQSVGLENEIFADTDYSVMFVLDVHCLYLHDVYFHLTRVTFRSECSTMLCLQFCCADYLVVCCY